MDERASRAGFTLLEVMVVVVILGLIGSMVAHHVLGHEEHARQTKAKLDVLQIFDAAQMFKVKKGRWPDSIEELIAGRPPSLRGYKEVPKDPWGNTYRCQPGDTSLDWEVYSYGPDGEEGGENDITSKYVQGG